MTINSTFGRVTIFTVSPSYGLCEGVFRLGRSFCERRAWFSSGYSFIYLSWGGIKLNPTVGLGCVLSYVEVRFDSCFVLCNYLLSGVISGGIEELEFWLLFALLVAQVLLLGIVLFPSLF